ncbi:DUF5672 family protein [Spirosoma agri]|uniref:DUF5672 domain-containing protein n=1 Tax=Spirosoma agri TaxID=1987381 RepID=A0A6M0IT49_9BACT|nr:DUF5672 family protein [Spirosoma agri]NEU70791.1 hypothetical protein [Spirosoma agri]
MNQSLSVSVNVVIPIYKVELTEYERISLTQCLRVLCTYPIYLAAPHSLDTSAYHKMGPDLQVRTFDDSYFTDIQAYNELLLSEHFYEAFNDQEYMLIYQLDAFVFRDELPYWCGQSYDYIGAPILRDRDFYGWFDRQDFTIRQQIATWFNLKKADGQTPREIISLNRVGNGGFSLRRVAAMVNGLRKRKSKVDLYLSNSLYQYNEDVFWSIEVNRYWPHLRIPPYSKALHFSIEFFPQWAVEHYNQGTLPFGCHAWDTHGTDYWRSIFLTYGYQI